MITDRDLAWGAVIAIVLILIVTCVWPGTARARPGDLAGYWAGPTGTLYAIKPLPGGFEVHGGAPQFQRGRIRGLRRLKLGSGAGTLEFGGRTITWRGGEKWIRQGVLRERLNAAS